MWCMVLNRDCGSIRLRWRDLNISDGGVDFFWRSRYVDGLPMVNEGRRKIPRHGNGRGCWLRKGDALINKIMDRWRYLL